VHVDAAVGQSKVKSVPSGQNSTSIPRERLMSYLARYFPTSFWLWSFVVLGSKSTPTLVLKRDLVPFSSTTVLPLLASLITPDLPPFVISREDLVVKIGNRDHNDEDKKLRMQKLGDNPLGLRERLLNP